MVEHSSNRESRHMVDPVNNDGTASQPFQLYASRHGETEWNKQHRINGNFDGDQLSEKGRASIPLLIQALGGLTILKLYSSPLQRAMDTAGPIAAHLNLPIQIDNRLIEVDEGSFTGEPWESTIAHFGKSSPQLLASCNYDFTPFGGESSQQVQERIGSFVRDAEEHALVIAHGGILYMLQYLSTGQPGTTLPNATIFTYTFPER